MNTDKKTAFMNKIQFLLSFQYSASECRNILTDYEEWFQEENRNGKSDAEICSQLGKPAEIVKKITAETKSEASKRSILLHHCILQFTVITGIRMFADLSAFSYCERNGLHYIFFALLLNAVYFACAMAAAKQTVPFSLLCRENLGMTVFAATALAVNLAVWNYAAGIHAGPNSVFVLTVLIYALYAATVIRGGWNVMRKESEIYMLALHATGLTSMLLYSIRQYHILSTDKGSWIRTSFAGSVGIYLEVITLVILFWLWKTHTQGDC